MSDHFWQIIASGRNGILATVNEDGTPQLSNIYYLADPAASRIRFSTTTTRTKGRNLVRFPRAALHVAGRILSTIMFNAAYASTISGTEPHDAQQAAEEMWEFVADGILTASK